MFERNSRLSGNVICCFFLIRDVIISYNRLDAVQNMATHSYYNIKTVTITTAVLLITYTGFSETRVYEDAGYTKQTPPEAEAKPEPLRARPAEPQRCFHMDREYCPPASEAMRCRKVDNKSVFCCDLLNSFMMQEGLAGTFVAQGVSYLHILNATIDDLDVQDSTFRRLSHMSITDGRIGSIKGQFLRMSPLTCLNFSNNNLTSDKLVGWSRPFAYVANLTVLDLSANNLTEIPISLTHVTRKIAVDLSGNNYTQCRDYLKVMEGNNSQLITFLNDNKTFCCVSLTFNWFNDLQFVAIDHVRIQKELNASCRLIEPTPDCKCTHDRTDVLKSEVITSVSVECSQLHLKQMPTNLPPNTISLNVSYNNISSLVPVSTDPTYERVRRLYIDHNDVQTLTDLEGTRFIDNFMVFSITANKLKTIHTYILSNSFDYSNQKLFFISKNHIHCDCNTVKVFKTWLHENSRNIPDYSELMCQDGMGPVIDLVESKVCHTQRNWIDYIYYIIGSEVTMLIILVSKVSYDYWVFKSSGYLPWPASKMPRMPCDWFYRSREEARQWYRSIACMSGSHIAPCQNESVLSTDSVEKRDKTHHVSYRDCTYK